MPQTPQGASNEEIAERLQQLRAINRRAAAGEITWQERGRQHNAVVPGIGGLTEHDTREQPSAAKRER